MAHEAIVEDLMNQLIASDKHVIGDIMAHMGIWSKGTSASNNSDKVLNVLTKFGKLDKVNGFYRLPNCRSEYKEHSQLLTKALAEIIKLDLNAKILRESTLGEVGLRPDAIVLLKKGNQGLCFILEVCNNETKEYLTQKVNVWRHWEGGTRKLSELLNVKIPVFDIVTAGGVFEGVFELNDYLQEVKNG